MKKKNLEPANNKDKIVNLTLYYKERKCTMPIKLLPLEV